MSALNKRIFAVIITLFGLIYSFNSLAQPVDITVHGNKVEAVINLTGNVEADFTLTFENTVGLTADNVGITAELVDITDLALLDRLPDNLNINLLSAFPMMITVEPPSSGGFSFSGLATVDIHTHNLEYTAGTPLRFFKAPLGGEFKDITATMGSGSYRARGTTGKFSQFIIVADLRLPIAVVNTKFTRLSNELTAFSTQIDPIVYNDLNAQLADIQQLIQQQDYVLASNKVDEFSRTVEQNRGTKIPDVWRSSRDVDNVAGELIALANTLRFSLRLVN
ncbi:DUF6689 family protein [Kangiella sediminilitoris]|uniref:Uncharacterized protein n=1 Tax=Kangiella sediminilitoris TaxID=1144748 RepID=A0A1B3BAJ8_9GAMM|nr:DUF6689 family protein [Kangiella sediminilitoris]AOE49820.1 hypothetical protein KS2013_1100 [Kangiella sediminilitoris]